MVSNVVTYEVISQADKAAKINNVVLCESNTFRKILVPELVRSSKDDIPKIKISITTERKSRNQTWEPVENIPATKLKVNESHAVQLDSDTTARLLESLLQMEEIANQGFVYGTKRFAVISLNEPLKISHIQKLFACPKELLEELASTSPPEIIRNFVAGKIQEERRQAVREFEESLIIHGENEKYWQNFFVKHTWIFGYGLNYAFLHLTRAQPNFRGASLDGKGTQRGDYLMHTAGSNFTVIVEIKTPATSLLQGEYRNEGEHAIWNMGKELVGGICQVQSYCRNWEREAQDATKNRQLIVDQIETITPKGILIVGNTDELEILSKKESFELFRRNLKTPEIITFNELLARAKYLASLPV